MDLIPLIIADGRPGWKIFTIADPIKEGEKMSNGLAVKENVTDRLGSLLKSLEIKAPNETKEIGALVKAIQDKELAILGEDEVFKLRDSNGEIRAFRSILHLSATDGTLIQPVPKGPFVISAQGYENWETAAAAITMKAPFVMVNGKQQSNPYPERDEKTGRLLAYHCRTIAFRFTNKGIPQVSDWTTIFDLPKYRLIDLLAKAKNLPQAFRLLPVGQKPNQETFKAKIGEWDSESEKKKFHEEEIMPAWACYPFDESTNFWVCTSHPEALTWYAQILNREKKAIDFAQTFSKRNALKHLSGLQRVPGQDKESGKVNPISSWNVSVTAWRPTSGSIVKWDLTTYSNVAKALTEASAGKSEALMIEASKGSEYVGDDPATGQEMTQIDQAEGDSQQGEGEDGNGKNAPTAEEEVGQTKSSTLDGSPPPTEPPPVKEKPKEPPKEELKGSYMDQIKAFFQASPKIYYQACKEAEIDAVLSEASALTVLKKCDEISKRPKKK
jgi:hypothetical protein